MAEPASKSPQLEPHQKAQAADRAPAQAIVLHEIIRAEGQAELERPASAMLWSGLAAGLSMGFSFVCQALLLAALPEAEWRHAVASWGYTVGFAIVVLGRQQLFTESTLSAVLPVLTRRDLPSVVATLRLWGLVLVANLVGTWLFAGGLVALHPLEPSAAPALARLAAESVSHPFGATLVHAIYAGWLIALMVWLLPQAEAARILVIMLLAWLVAFGRFSHIIAGSSEAAYGVLIGQASAMDYIWRFALPTLIGNTVGGVALVAMLNHAPVSHKVQDGG